MTRKAVLVTRPMEQSAGILKAIENSGAHPVAFPLLKLENLPIDQAAKQKVMNLDSYDLVIFISGPAVQFGMTWVENYWPQLPVAITWFAVGKATANRLRAYNIDVVTPARENSEGLLELAVLQQVSGKKVLIVRGTEGREKLADTLRSRGAEVDYLETYRRDRESWTSEDLYKLLEQHSIEIIMITSRAALDYLANLMQAEAAKTQIKLILPSERLLKMADRLGFPRCHLANGADDDSMLDALRITIDQLIVREQYRG
ncbi:MAG: uroporphyrinogen-III synthase [Gammaproteobacteria bacterium]|nr:uroporphyrinogen-III synthase [Gammaproteobacteria bacterium]